MAFKRQTWKERLLAHPLFVKLAEYGKMIDKCSDLLASVNSDLEKIRNDVPDELRKFLYGPIAKDIHPAGVRPIRMAQTGKYYLSWPIDGNQYYSFIMLNIRAISHGRVSNSLLPVAYVLGCVSDFEMLALSSHPVYGSWIKSLLKQYPAKGGRRK